MSQRDSMLMGWELNELYYECISCNEVYAEKFPYEDKSTSSGLCDECAGRIMKERGYEREYNEYRRKSLGNDIA
jgi:hypothetical protein